MLRSANPVLSEEKFSDVRRGLSMEPSEVMTLDGTLLKSAVLLLLVLLTASYTWGEAMAAIAPGTAELGAGFSSVAPWMWGGLIGGLVLALIISFKPTTAPYLAPLYAAAEGLFLGAISAAMNVRYPGIVVNAVLLTLGTAGGMLLLYKAGLIRATARFRSVLLCATFGIMAVYGVTILLGFFGVQVPYIHGSGPIGILFSLFVVTVAALNLILDFDLIETGIRRGAPKFMEWFAGFALLVTLVWLYIEFLRLLAKLQRR